MEFRIIIPARFESTRLPGKVLADINGKPMVQYVYENSLASGAESVVIATDNDQVREVAEGFGAEVVMTEASHQSGTERIAEAVAALDYDKDEIIVGVQADEPLVPPDMIRELAGALDEHDNVRIASLCQKITDIEELLDPNAVKVVLNRRHYAMYFSRATIPWDREGFKNQDQATISDHHYRHIGLYAYRAGFLSDYIDWPESPLEMLECLEQLRILWNGGRMHMTITKKKIPPGVDTPADLEKVRALMKEK